MNENNKKTNQTFLDKFKGRANRINKHGLTHALEPIQHPSSPSQEKPLPAQRKKLASLDHSASPEYQMPKVDLDQLIPSNPDGKSLSNSRKRSGKPLKAPLNKLQYVPSLYDPQKSPASLSTKQGGLHMPPSRSISDKSENLHRRVFGKYLKLDSEAMLHLQFLQEMNKGRGKVTGQHSFTN